MPQILGKFQHSSIWLRLLLWLALTALFTILAFSVWALSSDGTSTNSLKLLQFLQTLGTFLLPALLASCLWSEHPLQWLKLDKGTPWHIALYGVCLMLFAIPSINMLSNINQQLILPESLKQLEEWMRNQEDAANLLTERFLQVHSAVGLLINLSIMALLPAIAEELCFRGVLQSLLAPKKYNNTSFTNTFSPRVHIAIWVTAAIFSFIHFQFYGFVPRMLMGAMFGYMVAGTGSLWIPILMHFTNNATAVLAYYYTYNYHIETNLIESIGTGDTVWLGISSLVITISGTILILKTEQKQRKQQNS